MCHNGRLMRAAMRGAAAAEPIAPVYDCVAFAPFDPLARVISALPPFERALTDWESIMAALGLARRPALARTCWRSSASSAFRTPRWRQRAKVLQTCFQSE